MHFAALLTTAALAVASTDVTRTSACPYNYPPQLNTTASSHGLIFTITSSNPVTNNRSFEQYE
jgi:hypothetical protein